MDVKVYLGDNVHAELTTDELILTSGQDRIALTWDIVFRNLLSVVRAFRPKIIVDKNPLDVI